MHTMLSLQCILYAVYYTYTSKDIKNMYQINFSTGKEYQGQNQLILQCHNYSSNEWGTFLQWRTAGLVVKKGEKGTHIVKVVEYKDKDNKSKAGMRGYTVFNREQVQPVMQLVSA